VEIPTVDWLRVRRVVVLPVVTLPVVMRRLARVMAGAAAVRGRGWWGWRRGAVL